MASIRYFLPIIGRYTGIIPIPVATLLCYQFVTHLGHMLWHPERLIVTNWRKWGYLSTQGHYIEVAEARITAHMGFRRVTAVFAAHPPGTHLGSVLLSIPPFFQKRCQDSARCDSPCYDQSPDLLGGRE